MEKGTSLMKRISETPVSLGRRFLEYRFITGFLAALRIRTKPLDTIYLYNADKTARFAVRDHTVSRRLDFKQIALHTRNQSGGWNSILFASSFGPNYPKDPIARTDPINLDCANLTAPHMQHFTGCIAWYTENGKLMPEARWFRANTQDQQAVRADMYRRGHFKVEELPAAIDVTETMRLFLLQMEKRDFSKPKLVPALPNKANNSPANALTST